MSKLLLSYLFKTNLAAFRSAILDENTDKICRILDFERDFLNKDIDSVGNTALLLAIQYTSPLTVRLLLDHGAQPDQPNGISFQTPLGLLASKVYNDYHSYKAQRTLEMTKILLDYGAYVDKPQPCIYKDEHYKDYTGKETPLMKAVRKRNLPLVKLLIERKANVNYIERQSQIRCIHYAITNGDEDMFDVLANAGALASPIVTAGNNTLLHWFCYKKENDEHISLLNKLIAKESDINAQNWQKRTPLMIAVKNDMSNTCRLLIKNQADINKYDCDGNQAIDLSVPGSECSKILLQATNTEKSKLQLPGSPFNKHGKTIIRTQRLDMTRRRMTETSDIKIGQTNDGDSSSKQSNEEKQSNASGHSCIYPKQLKDNDETETKYERIWDKSLPIKQSPRLANKLYKERAYSADSEATSRL